MSMNQDVTIRTMETGDYDQVARLWTEISGFAIRKLDDSREGIERFIRRNPTTSVVAELDGQIVGTILCGHDGRQACFYHVCVKKEYRMQGIGTRMAQAATQALMEEKINKAYLIAFKKNEAGNAFWKSVGWDFRDDRNYYEFILNRENQITFNQ